MLKYGWTKHGACQILQLDGARAQVHLSGKKRAEWISKTQLLPTPRNIMLAKTGEFDQKCGLISCAAIRGKQVEAFNLYGRLAAFLASGAKAKGSDATPYARRKSLKENKFSRARGRTDTCKDVAHKLFEYQRRGYKVVEVTASPARQRVVKAAPKAAPAPAPVVEAPVAPVVAAPAPAAVAAV